MMFSRNLFRPANALRTQIRRYATEPPKGSSSNSLLFGAVGAAAVGGGYYYYSQNTAQSDTKSAIKSSPASGKVAFTGGDQGFISLKLENVEILNHNTKLLRFNLPEGDMTAGLPVASAVITKFKGPEMEKPVIRPYTPTSDIDAQGYVDFVIKKYPDGPMSTHLHDMIPGQRLDIKGPIPKYAWSPNKHEHVVMIAGGTGITPMWQIAQAIFKNPEDKTKVTLVFGNVSEEDILLKKELEHLENTYPRRFRAFYVLDNPPKEWQGGKGFVTKELLKTVCPEPKEGEKIKIFVCGPPPMYKALSGMKKSPADQGELSGVLADLGYSKDQVYKF